MIKYYQLLFKKVLYQVWKRMSLTDTKSKIIRMCLKYSVIKERLDLSLAWESFTSRGCLGLQDSLLSKAPPMILPPEYPLSAIPLASTFMAV